MDATNAHLIRSRSNTYLSFSSVVDRALECGNSDTATVGNCFVVLMYSKGRNYVNVRMKSWCT